jgi:tungstate transport system permease protein
MTDLTSAFALAFHLIASGDQELLRIIALSLRVSLTAVCLGCLIGFPLGAALAVFRFPGRTFVIAVLNACMGLPPVVIGLLVYLMLSRAGPLGILGLLYTPAAMIIAQTLLIAPLIAALARGVLADLYTEYDELFRSLRIPKIRQTGALLWDGRYSLITVGLAGLGRAIAEVGAVIIVGGNIAGLTRVMTTAIALETSKGDLGLALGLGIILITIAILINVAVLTLRGTMSRLGYA